MSDKKEGMTEVSPEMIGKTFENPPREQITLCKDCHYFNPSLFPSHFSFSCGNKEAPYTDFVTGYKSPDEINNDGQCKYFLQAQSEPQGEIKIVPAEKKIKQHWYWPIGRC